MTFSLDSHELGFPCPKCGHKLSKTFGWLKTHTNITCPGCSASIDLKTDQLLRTVAKVEQEVNKLPTKIILKL